MRTLLTEVRELNAKISAIGVAVFEKQNLSTPKAGPFTAFSMSIDPLYGVDLHFSAPIVEETLREMAPTLMPALEAMRDAMVRKYAPQPVAAKQPKKQPATSDKKNAKAKKAR